MCGAAVAAVLAACTAVTSDASREQEEGLWRQLGGWTYIDGTQGIPESVRRLSGSTIRISGYPVPLDGNEMLLVPSLRALERDFQVNQAIVVILAGPPSQEMFTSRVRIAGVLQIDATRVDGYCIDIYRVRADDVEILESWAKTGRISGAESPPSKTTPPAGVPCTVGG
jgi:hypothetical protein